MLRKGVLYFYRDKAAFDSGDEKLLAAPLRYLRITVELKKFYRPSNQVLIT